MKYLKKIFENNLMLDTNILGDILQEITDLGYLSHVNSSWWSDDRGNGISVCIYGKDEYDKIINQPVYDTVTVDDASIFQMMFGKDSALRKEYMMV